MSVKHFLTLEDFSKQEIQALLGLAKKMKVEQKQGMGQTPLTGKTIALIFEKPSTRTRLSFEVGIHQLGGKAITLSGDEIGIGKREETKDIARVVSRYVDGIMIRANRHEDVTTLAAFSSVPIINGLTDYCHPCQALADVMTIQEHKGPLDQLTLTYLGDGNNVCQSLMTICRVLGIRMKIGCPEAYQPDTTGYSNVNVFSDPYDAVKDADVVYTDVWTSMGQEKETQDRLKAFAPFSVSASLMAHAKKDAIFMHCLPAHRGEEVQNEVLESAGSVVFDQAENRLHAQKAVLATLL